MYPFDFLYNSTVVWGIGITLLITSDFYVNTYHMIQSAVLKGH